MRWMCVSTGNMALPKANSSVQCAVEVGEIVKRIAIVQLREELEVDLAALSLDLAEDRLNARGFKVA
jgi:hypothetical protein